MKNDNRIINNYYHVDRFYLFTLFFILAYKTDAGPRNETNEILGHKEILIIGAFSIDIAFRWAGVFL